MLGAGSVTVKANSTFCGRGKLDNSTFTVEKDGLLYPGISETATTGSIDFSENSVTIDKGGILSMNIASKTRCTNLTGIKILNLYGILRLHVRESLALEAGDEFRLWEASRTRIRPTTAFELDSPGEGLEWDTTDIEDGIVRVKLSTSVNDIHADEESLAKPSPSEAHMQQFHLHTQGHPLHIETKRAAPALHGENHSRQLNCYRENQHRLLTSIRAGETFPLPI